MNERYYSLQILRAVAAWMVVYHHYMQLFYNFNYKTAIGHFFSSYGSFGVDIFFVISGFVMYFSAKSPTVNASSFFIKRIFRIAPAYWFYSLVMVLFVLIFPVEFSYTDYNIQSLIASLAFYPNANPSGIGVFPLHTVGWTLNFEMMFYAILSFSILLSKKNSLIICCALIVLFPVVWPGYLPFSEVLGSSKLYEFFGGIVVAVVVASKWLQCSNKHQAALSAAIFVFGLLCFEHSHFISAVAIVLSAALLNQHLNMKNIIVKVLVKAGDYSYSTYLIHVFFIGAALHYFGNESSQLFEKTVIVGLTAIIFAASKYSYMYLENNRYLLLLRQRLLSSANKANLLGQKKAQLLHRCAFFAGNLQRSAKKDEKIFIPYNNIIRHKIVKFDPSIGLSTKEIGIIKYNLTNKISLELPTLPDPIETRLFLQGRNAWMFNWKLMNNEIPITTGVEVILEVTAKLKKEFHEYLDENCFKYLCTVKMQKDLYHPKVSVQKLA